MSSPDQRELAPARRRKYTEWIGMRRIAVRHLLTGDLQIHGVTREVALDVVTEGMVRDPWGNEKAGFSAKGLIKRSDFGLTWNAALETGGFVVGDDVKLVIDVELTRT